MAAQDPIPVFPMMYPVTLKFYPGSSPTFEFSGCMVDDMLQIDQALGMIVIQLQTSGVTFGSSPIVWTDEVPTCMSVSRDSDTQVTIINWNSNTDPTPEGYNFQVVVWYEGFSYMSHDPTIINATVPTPAPPCEKDGDEDERGRRVKRETAPLRAV